jgi:hypothetical protein
MFDKIESYLLSGGLKLKKIVDEGGVTKIKTKQTVQRGTVCPKCKGSHITYKSTNKVFEYLESPLIADGPTVLQVVRKEGTCQHCKTKFIVPSPIIQDSLMTKSLKSWIEFLLDSPDKMSNAEIAEEACVDEKIIKKIIKTIKQC